MAVGISYQLKLIWSGIWLFCKHYWLINVHRQTVWTQIRLLLQKHSVCLYFSRCYGLVSFYLFARCWWFISLSLFLTGGFVKLCIFLTVLWLCQIMLVPRDTVCWTVCVSSSWCFGLVSLSLSSRYCWLVMLSHFRTVLMYFCRGTVDSLVCLSFSWCCEVCKFSLPHGAVGWSVCVFISRCCGFVSLSLFLMVLWVGQFVSLPHGAVGW